MNKEIKSLYRVYRPQKFEQVIGQEHITRTLQNQIIGNKVNHAYLFCGTRGTGKTSVAKIFARYVNKVSNEKANETSQFDIFEIDAASNNSVQDVRDLIEKVKYPPIQSKYKVYIIDEVHMFSGSAFNALLKTLEEPPSHVVFILCTTEPHKLLPTVQSRVLRFDFRPVSVDQIEKRITEIFKKEKIISTKESIKMLAMAGNGSVRDSLSLAETVISFCGEKDITEKDVSLVLGTVEKSVLEELLQNILSNEPQKIIACVNKIFSIGINTSELIKQFLEVIRDNYLKSKQPKILRYYKTFSELENTIKTATSAQALFEGACLICLIHQ